ncbi:kinetochore-associated Ndc80 complex subunit spc25 [Mortierella alpina]|nr:kinetochore-associated Ndc80 complex subunit spc25 [Mortierella alpina]
MASTTAALSASGSASGAGPSSIGSTIRSSSGGRSSMAEATTHRLSIGNRRLSQLPPKNNNALTSLLPLPQFDSDEIHAHAAAFTNEFNSYTQKTKAKITESSEQWDRETAELQDHDRTLREDLKVATLKEAALAKGIGLDSTRLLVGWLRQPETNEGSPVETVEKEEAGNMSKTIQQLSARREEMRQMQASLESQVSLLRKEVKAKREAKFAQKKALDEQILKNKPEVSCYESVLAMRIVGVQEDRIGFVFTRINEQDWDQEFSITIDVSQYDYSASECVPSLPELPSLVRYLNDTRDLYGFLKRVRKGFKDLCKK